MALSSIAICSRALLKLGGEPIASFEDGTAESVAAGLLYPSTRDALLSAYPWNFATTQKKLTRLVAQPVADFTYAYQLPNDFLRALSAGPDSRGRGVDYQIVERRLHTNTEDVTLTYVFRPHEAAFPAFFDQALIMRMAAEFCLPLTESVSRTESLFQMAEKELRQAKLVDAQQDVPSRFELNTLIEARS